MTTKMKIMTPIAEGMRASRPPDLESSPCLLAIFDFFFFFMTRLLCDVVVVVFCWGKEDRCLDHAVCRSLFLLRLSCDVVDVGGNED